MKIKVTMILEIDADSIEEAQEIFQEWDDQEFAAATWGADVSFEAVVEEA